MSWTLAQKQDSHTKFRLDLLWGSEERKNVPAAIPETPARKPLPKTKPLVAIKTRQDRALYTAKIVKQAYEISDKPEQHSEFAKVNLSRSITKQIAVLAGRHVGGWKDLLAVKGICTELTATAAKLYGWDKAESATPLVVNGSFTQVNTIVSSEPTGCGVQPAIETTSERIIENNPVLAIEKPLQSSDSQSVTTDSPIET